MEVFAVARTIAVLALSVGLDVVSNVAALLHIPLAYAYLAGCYYFLGLFAVLPPKEPHP